MIPTGCYSKPFMDIRFAMETCNSSSHSSWLNRDIMLITVTQPQEQTKLPVTLDDSLDRFFN